MSKTIVCYKWVKDEADIKVNPDLSVDLSKAKGKISDYDKNAIEAAVQAARLLAGKSIGLTFGTPKTKQSLKDALSRGLEEVCWINTEAAAEADGIVTSKALAAAIKKMDDVSLVICAEGASDTYARQTAPRLGALLQWPVITSVSKIQINGDILSASRKLDDCIETVKVKLPAVIAVLPEICNAPIPGLKAVMAAGKKPIAEYQAGDIGIDFTSKSQVSGLKAYAMNRKNIILEGDTSEKIASLVAALKKEGVL